MLTELLEEKLTDMRRRVAGAEHKVEQFKAAHNIHDTEGQILSERHLARLWPEFAANGKERISLDQTMSHTAGLQGLSVPMDLAGLCAWTPYVEALAAMAPLWEPGSRCVYHALTYGHLAGEPLRRVDGRSVGRFIAEEIAGPLGVPFFVGLPEAEDHRVAEIIEGPNTADWVAGVLDSGYPNACANPTPNATDPNKRIWRAAEIPGGNGHATAARWRRSTATWSAASRRCCRPVGLAAATRSRYDGIDRGFMLPTEFAAGFRLNDPEFGPHVSPGNFGHAGWGGTIAFGDPAARLGFALRHQPHAGLRGRRPAPPPAHRRGLCCAQVTVRCLGDIGRRREGDTLFMLPKRAIAIRRTRQHEQCVPVSTRDRCSRLNPLATSPGALLALEEAAVVLQCAPGCRLVACCHANRFPLR